MKKYVWYDVYNDELCLLSKFRTRRHHSRVDKGGVMKEFAILMLVTLIWVALIWSLLSIPWVLKFLSAIGGPVG